MEPPEPKYRERSAPSPAPERSTGASLLLPRLFLLLLAAAAAVIYLPSVDSPMVFDDFHNIVSNSSIQVSRLDPASLFEAAFPSGKFNLRPLAFLSFALNYRLGGLDPFGYHIVNLLILLLSIPIVFRLSLLLFRTLARFPEATAPSLAVTTLWTMNPLLTNGVTYIVQRMTSMSTLLSLVFLFCFIKGRVEGRPVWYGAAVLSMTAALAAKENALLLPLLALLFMWFTYPENSPGRRRAGVLLAGVVFLTQAALILFSHYLVVLRWIPRWSFGLDERFLTESRVIVKYISLWLLPLPSRMSIDHGFPLSTSLFNPASTFLSMLLHTSLLLTAFSLRKRRPLFSFATLSFYLLQLAEGTFLPIDIIFEHRVYFPSFFLALALVDLCLWCLKKAGISHAGRTITALAVLTGIFWGFLSYQRNVTWSEPLRLWQDAVNKSPSHARALTNLGMTLNLAGRHREAVAVLMRSIRQKPNSAGTLHQLGNALSSLGRHEEARRSFEKSLAIDPDAAETHHHLGNALLSLGRHEEARRSFEKSLIIKPNSAEVYNSMAVMSGMLGHHDRAIRNFRKALELRPDYTSARYNLGITYAGQGSREKALSEYRILSREDPALAASLLGEINRRKN